MEIIEKIIYYTKEQLQHMCTSYNNHNNPYFFLLQPKNQQCDSQKYVLIFFPHIPKI